MCADRRLDYVAFAKPIILWGPEYCTPVRVTRKNGGAMVVDKSDAEEVVSTCRQLARAIRRSKSSMVEDSKVILEDSNNSNMVDNRNIMAANSSTRDRAKDKGRDRTMRWRSWS